MATILNVVASEGQIPQIVCAKKESGFNLFMQQNLIYTKLFD